MRYSCDKKRYLHGAKAALFGATALATPHVAYAEYSGASLGAIAEDLKLKPIVDVRYRTERVEREDLDETALAHTLRARYGFKFSPADRLDVLVEGESVLNLNDRFNSATNGETTFPVVPDPKETELNRAQATFRFSEKANVTIGRQKIVQSNQRFLGAVNFRQNQQTFDAVRFIVKPTKNITLDYAYIDRVHRIFGDAHPAGNFNSNSHIARAEVKTENAGAISGYVYALDFNNANALSSLTVGARVQNQVPLDAESGTKLAYALEYARQTDHAENPNEFEVGYFAADAKVSVKSVAIGGGYERLGGDGTVGFSTPLATLHKFQGFADSFLQTPANGIEDYFATFAATRRDVGPIEAITFKATAHFFDSTGSSQSLGREADFVLSFKKNDRMSAELKGAIFDGREFGPPNTAKLWASIRFVV